MREEEEQVFTVAEFEEQQAESKRLESLRKELKGVTAMVHTMLTDYPETRTGCAKTMSVKYWRARCTELGITDLNVFFNRYLNTKDIFSEASISAASRNVKQENPHLKPPPKVQEKVENTRQVYVQEYNQKDNK